MYGSLEKTGEKRPLVNPSEDMESIKLAPINLCDQVDGADSDEDNEAEATSITSENFITDFMLHQAATEGAIDQVKQLLSLMKQCGCNIVKEINKPNLEGYSALHLASRFNRKSVVIFLLDNGAFIDQPDSEENSPLHLAAKYNMTSSAKCLCERGANILQTNIYGSTPLHFATRRGNEKLCKELINRNADVNASDHGMSTPLHSAMLGGSAAVTSLLLEHGADVYARDREGESPIHYAASDDQGDLISLLARKAVEHVSEDDKKMLQTDFINMCTDEKDTPLHIAAQAGYLDTVKSLVSMGADVDLKTDTKSTALHLAAVSGEIEAVKFLVRNKAKVNVTDDQNMTPLHKACQYGRIKVIQFLQQSGAFIDSKDEDHFTPLMCAVWKGQNNVVSYLLENGAKPHIVDKEMKNVLHIAIEERHPDTLVLLLDNGCTNLINSPDKDYRTPLHYAAKFNDEEAMDILLNKNADVDIGDNEERTPLHIAAEYGHVGCINMLGRKDLGMVNLTDEQGKSPLHWSAMSGKKQACIALIGLGAEISSRDDVNWTPLDYAARNGHSKAVNVLLDNEALVDACDKNKLTPLHHASINGHTDCIKILLDNGASISHQNVKGKNCLDFAVENFQNEACMAFITHKRWVEAISHVDNDGYHPMEKLIYAAPEVAKVVMDRCVQPSEHNIKHEDYNVTYDFKFLDIHPDKQINEKYFAPLNMVKYQREDLLSHPLTVKLISDKWGRIGRWVYIASLSVYMLYVSLLSSLLVIDKQSVDSTEKSTFQRSVPWLTLFLSIFQIIKEGFQAYFMGKQYFKDLNNYLEIVLYTATIVFMCPFIIQNVEVNIDSKWYESLEELKWNAGAIAILLAWCNLLLYLKRFPFFGLYVVMFVEVLKTVLSVMLVFSFIIIAFTLSFYVLFGKQTAFQYAGRSVFKTIVMTIGEFEYDDIFAYNVTTNLPEDPQKLPYPVTSFILFTIFLLICPIIIMNLLVGLAVGDIDAVRKSAYIRILKAQVQILKSLEGRCPDWVLRNVYRWKVVSYPNSKGFRRKFFLWLGRPNYDFLKNEQELISGKSNAIVRELESHRAELDKQKKRIKSVTEMVEEQSEMMQLICEKLKIEDDD